MSATPTARRRTVRLRAGALSDEELSRYGWRSVTAAARACGISPSTLTRCIAGDISPGGLVIAALLDGTRRPFDQLFELVDA